MHNAISGELDFSRAPSVFDIDVLQVAKVYANALLRAAAERKLEDQFQEVFNDLVGNPLKLPDEKDNLAGMLASQDLPKVHRTGLLKKLFDGKVHELFVDFLQVLNDHDRLDLLRPIALMYHQLRDDLHKRVRVQVRSAVPLDAGQRDQLGKLARQRFNLEPVLVETVDPSLLGGFQIQVGDRLVDLSVKYRLESIKNQLIERSSHEIQRRRDSVGSQV